MRRQARLSLRKVKAEVMEAQAHQDCPFEKIVQSVKVERRAGRNPLYNVALLFQNLPEVPQLGAGLECSPLAVPVEAPLLDLRFEANQTAAGIALTCEYKSDFFSAGTIAGLLDSFRAVLETLARSPQSKLAEFAWKMDCNGISRPIHRGVRHVYHRTTGRAVALLAR